MTEQQNGPETSSEEPAEDWQSNEKYLKWSLFLIFLLIVLVIILYDLYFYRK